MKLGRIVLIIIVIVILLVASYLAYEFFFAPSPSNSSSWSMADPYPLQLSGVFGVGGQQCLSYSTRIYCIGGADSNLAPRSEIYVSSPLSASSPNVTSWSANPTSYPKSIHGHSCVTDSNYVYCVGGSYDDGGDDLASSYFSSINSSGALGSWNSTTPYPIPIDTSSCVQSSGYIYCVGGNNETDGTNGDSALSNSVYFAQLNSSGIGAWQHTTSYPSGVYLASCSSLVGYIYCVGGTDSNNNNLNQVYYAALSSSGVGTWSAGTNYPVSGSGLSCVTALGNIYCVGVQTGQSSYSNEVYYAPISSSGVRSWQKGSSSDYPLGVSTDCALSDYVLGLGSSPYVYCVGGLDGSSQGNNADVYYASLNSITS
jgi:hypothetical protein